MHILYRNMGVIIEFKGAQQGAHTHTPLPASVNPLQLVCLLTIWLLHYVLKSLLGFFPCKKAIVECALLHQHFFMLYLLQLDFGKLTGTKINSSWSFNWQLQVTMWSFIPDKKQKHHIKTDNRVFFFLFCYYKKKLLQPRQVDTLYWCMGLRQNS